MNTLYFSFVLHQLKCFKIVVVELYLIVLTQVVQNLSRTDYSISKLDFLKIRNTFLHLPTFESFYSREWIQFKIGNKSNSLIENLWICYFSRGSQCDSNSNVIQTSRDETRHSRKEKRTKILYRWFLTYIIFS
jgi:hypothetical protein